MKKFIVVLFIALACGFIPAISARADQTALPPPPDGCEKIAETSGLALYLNRTTGGIAVCDKSNGYYWKSFVDSDSYTGYDAANPLSQSNMNSIFSLLITDLSRDKINPRSVESNTTNRTLDITDIPNGVSETYYFTDFGIGVTVEFALDGDQLVVDVPQDKIREDGILAADQTLHTYGIMTLSLLPFFGAADNRVNGYLFYPDQSGAICRYDNAWNRPQNLKAISLSVYGLDFGSMTANMPVYGIKNNDNAILAAITSGETSTNITVKPDGNVMNLNRINFDLLYRETYIVQLSNVSINGTGAAKLTTDERAEKNIRALSREIRIFFLSGDNANYSGMANVYRDYLIQNGLLKSSIQPGSSAPMRISLLMGASKPGLLFTSFIKMTTYTQAESILKDLVSDGVTNMQAKLMGWYSGGASTFYTKATADWRLGGTGKLKGLASYASDNNIPLYLETNVLFGDTHKLNFSTSKDVIYGADNIPYRSPDKQYYLLNATAGLRFTKAAAKKVTYAGLSLSNIGNFVTYDFNRKNTISGQQNVVYWQQAFEAALSNGYPLEVGGSNQYTFAYASSLLNVSYVSSRFTFTDEDVPFLEMVIHGSISYSFDALNLVADPQKSKLQTIEYGATPSYTITQADPYLLRESTYATVFTSMYSDWSQTIKDTYNEFEQRVGATYSAKMIYHEQVMDNVYLTKYDNGESIYINYTDADVTVDGYKVPATDYIVVGSGGDVR